MSEYFITATIHLKTALHIGTGKGGGAADSSVRRRGDGTIFIPGRAIGGSLRTLATRIAPRLGYVHCYALQEKLPKEPCPCPVCDLFGNIRPTDPEQKPADEARASSLWIYDALINETHLTYVRDGVGIDRSSGTASRHVKFSYETVPAGTTFVLKMRLAARPEEKETNMILLAAVLAEWQSGRGQLGSNVARGLGQFWLEGVEVRQTKLATADDLITYLRAANIIDSAQLEANWQEDWLNKALKKRSPVPANAHAMSVPTTFLQVEFTLAFEDLFLLNDPIAGLLSGFDHAPLVEMVNTDGVGRPVLSGSSLRGVLRSHAEKIARTLATIHWGQDEATAYQKFTTHCPACNVLTRDADAALASCDSRLNIPSTSETPESALCLSCRLFGSQRRGSRLWVRDAHVVKEVLDENDWQAQDFLAIDRFTGGGVSGAKFDAAPLRRLSFKGQLILQDPVAWELGWLVLILRDLAQGQLTVGMGAAKGFGRLVATNFIWAVGSLHETDLHLFPNALAPSVADGIYNLSKNKTADWLPVGWEAKAQEWVKTFNKQVVSTEYNSQELTPLQNDTFFQEGASRMWQLYGLSRAEVKQNE